MDGGADLDRDRRPALRHDPRSLRGVGLKGWQWPFICAGVPTVLLGLVVLFYLTDGPEEASWLDSNERAWLSDRLRRERMVRESHARHCLW
jgi:MFS transporter, ACS family, tartrate transporter